MINRRPTHLFILSCLLMCCGGYVSAEEAGKMDGKFPCKEKREAKFAAHHALRECVEAWVKDRNPSEADPSDDCSSKTLAFVNAAKETKACIKEHHKK